MLQEGKERPSACETFAAGLREKSIDLSNALDDFVGWGMQWSSQAFLLPIMMIFVLALASVDHEMEKYKMKSRMIMSPLFVPVD